MIGSVTSGRAAWGALLLGCLAVSACSTPTAPPRGSALMQLPNPVERPPDDVDRRAHDLAVAALASGWLDAERVYRELEALDAERVARGGEPTGLVPIARDVTHATFDDPVVYRSNSARLLARNDLDPALRARLEQVVADDPMRLADARIRDARIRSFGGVWNALVAPVSKSVMNGSAAVLGLGQALLGLVVREHLEDEITVPERQALQHWRRHLEEDPDAPDREAVREDIDEAEGRWSRTQRDRMLRAARRSLAAGQPAAAQLLADRALRFLPEDGEALELRDEAEKQRLALRAAQVHSLEATAGADVAPVAARPLAIALLAPDGDVGGAAAALLASDPKGPLSDEARFAEAIRCGERGEESQMWARLERLADADDARSNMARHARALVEQPDQNPYRAFREARADDRAEQLRWVLLGPLFRGPRDLDLPGPSEWLVEAPAAFKSLASLPNRLITYPWLEPWPFGRKPARHARQYLSRSPGGAHAEEVRDWLRDFEERRGNDLAVLHLAESSPTADPDDLRDLAERASQQMLDAARRESRPDYRQGMLRQVVSEFPKTRAGREAGHLLRLDAQSATPQRIRVSRGFLLENPALTGPRGLGLRPGMLDGDPANGELHPEGISFVGGRTLEFAFVAPGGDEDDAPTLRNETVSDERLARAVAMLDEITRRNELLDPEATVEPDAARELFFERARLGVADRPDRRPGARSAYTYLGMRERYGLVRARESILPVDLVIQGSLSELGIGAFPRIRMPKPTPDAILYE
ncbi:MAG: hypothetical protein JSU66_12070 [Deltaproteobacteria bacterium]|nr:MAG: hypothetical protein JSU66_12070 [Deltaproteobacteria bacterium]